VTFLVQSVVAIAAGLVRGFSGFGAALILAPGFTLVMSAQQAVALTLLLNFMTVLQQLLPALGITRWREIAPMGIAGMAAVPLGNLALVALDSTVIRRAIGAVVFVFAVILLTGWRYVGPRRLWVSVLTGAFGGFLTGSAGVGGPPVILYLLSGDRPVAENRAGFISFFAMLQLAALPVLLTAGLVTWDLVGRAVLLVPVYLLATHIGTSLFHRASEPLVRQLALGFLVVMGLVTLAR